MAETQITKKKVFSGFAWRFAERFGSQGLSFVLSILLARLIDPGVYGTVALLIVYTNVMSVIIDCGLGNALIQKLDSDELDFSTAFFTNLVLGVLMYAVVFFSAPYVAAFYNDASITAIFRVLGLIVIFSGLKNTLLYYISRNLMFRKMFFSSLAGIIAAAATGLTLAYLGYGVWALVAQQVANIAVDTLVLWIIVKWRPKAAFSFKRLKGLFSYGWKLLAASLLDTLYVNVRQLVIGKVYSAEDLAYYNKGEHFPSTASTGISTSIDSVLFPTICGVQNDRETVRSITRRSLKISTYIMAPLMTGIAVCAEPLVSLLLTDKWLPCVPYMRVFCFVYLLYTINSSNLQAIKAVGRSDISLKLEIIKKLVGFAVLLATLNYGVIAIALGLAAAETFGALANVFPNRKLIGYGYRRQFMDVLPNLIMAAIMGAIVYCANFLPLAAIWILLIQVAAGVALYLLLSLLFRADSLRYMLDFLRELKSGKDKNAGAQAE